MAIDKFLVEASHIMMFARSVGDANPIYHDEEYAKETELGGIIAPPTFAQSSAQFDPDYFLRPKIGGEGWFGSGKEPTGAKPSKESGGGGGGEGCGGAPAGADCRDSAKRAARAARGAPVARHRRPEAARGGCAV